ncbi:MAG: N-acetyltransferase [Candidatus Wenzhouxiangella sp. M2_3B_020]
MQAVADIDVSVSPVRTRSEWKAFHDLPGEIHAGGSRWVKPLALQARQAWAPRHPFFAHAQAQAWIALRNGRVVGRISAQVDALQREQGRPETGHFGQLEAFDDAAVFEALLDTAERWLAERGMRVMQGPFDLSINQQCGLLVSGFEHAPMMMMNYAPPYYSTRVEALDFDVAAETLAYRGPPDYRLPGRIGRLLDRLGNRLSIRPLARRELSDHAELMRELFNAAWADNWGFVPLTRAEFAHMMGEMKLLIRPGYVQLATLDGEPAGFIVALPDFNELVADLDGRLLPTGAVKLLWRLARKRGRRARIPLMGIAPGLKRSYTGAAVSYALIEAVRWPLVADGIEETEQSWILEQNSGMRAIVEAIGMRIAQRFRIYQRPIRA